MTSLSEEEIDEEGLAVEDGIPKDPASGKIIAPDKGWAFNPGEEGLDAWQPDMSKYPEELRKSFRRRVRSPNAP